MRNLFWTRKPRINVGDKPPAPGNWNWWCQSVAVAVDFDFFWQIIGVIFQLLSVGKPIEWIKAKHTYIAQLLSNLCKQHCPFFPFPIRFTILSAFSPVKFAKSRWRIARPRLTLTFFAISQKKGCILIFGLENKGMVWSIFFLLSCEGRDKNAFALIESRSWWEMIS